MGGGEVLKMKILNIGSYILLTCIGLVACALLLSVLPIHGTIKLMVVQSGSMEPTISAGSVVIVRPASEYRVGDIITFGPYSKTKEPTTHRIYEMKVVGGEPVYITKGDANNGPDIREVVEQDVIGRVLFSIPYTGYVLVAVRKPLWFLLLILLPVSIVLFGEIRKVIRNIYKKEK